MIGNGSATISNNLILNNQLTNIVTAVQASLSAARPRVGRPCRF
jgi:hypothetical protein